MFPYNSIKSFQEAILNGQTTCEKSVRHFLSEIEHRQELNAFLEVFEAEALERAETLDRLLAETGRLIGPMHGVVIGIKDVICYKGHRVSAASKILDGFVSLYDATATEKLLESGAIIIGRNNCDEFAMGSSNENSAFGAVKNALDINKVPGGSSGGSAVAVQAGLCMASLGSDTGGSVRQPADFCGIVGLKPSYGRISRHGLIAYASSFDQIGIFTRNIEDAALILSVISGQDEFDSTVAAIPVPDYSTSLAQYDANKSYRFAYFEEMLHHPAIDKEIASSILRRINSLREEGHTVEPLRFGLMPYIVPTYYILTTAEASSNLSRYDGVKFGFRSQTDRGQGISDLYMKTRSQGFGKEVQRRILLGTFVLSSGFFEAYFTKAQQVRRLLFENTKTYLEQYDAILSPTVPSTAFPIGAKKENLLEMYLADIFTVYANLVGLPAISLPLFNHSNGMPFGIQLMTGQFEEEKMLQLSKMLMESTS